MLREQKETGAPMNKHLFHVLHGSRKLTRRLAMQTERLGNILTSGRKLAHDQMLFIQEWAHSPMSIGAVCASSPFLADTMAQAVPLEKSGLIVELGAGTGSVTKALLRAGIAPERLRVIEKSDRLAGFLQQQFPDVQILGAGAETLRQIVETAGRGATVDAIVSSLPLRSLPQAICKEILEQVANVLCVRGVYVQFTYALFGQEISNLPPNLRKVHTQTVLRNIPPAKVEVYRKKC